MKTLLLVGASVVALALTGSTVCAGQPKVRKTKTGKVIHKPTPVVLVEITGSRIPERVTLQGRNVNSASRLSVVRSADHAMTGNSVASVLAFDPDITVKGATGF